jgi:hypothetical protein
LIFDVVGADYVRFKLDTSHIIAASSAEGRPLVRALGIKEHSDEEFVKRASFALQAAGFSVHAALVASCAP